MARKRITIAKLTVFILIFLLLFWLAVGTAMFSAFFEMMFPPSEGPEEEAPGPCAAEGESVGGEGDPAYCCGNLTAFDGIGGYEGACIPPLPTVGYSVCSDCGNGVCEIKNNENKCNCLQDCRI